MLLMGSGHGSYRGSAWGKGKYSLHGMNRKRASITEETPVNTQRVGLRHVTWGL